MDAFDYIVVGGGMGGLSIGNFLAKYGKKVLLLEKEGYTGGQMHSFKRGNYQFDSTITHLKFVREGGLIGPLMDFWNAKAEIDEIHHKFIGISRNRRYEVRSTHLSEDLLKAFPGERKDIERYMDILKKIDWKKFKVRKPPYQMNLIDQVRFLFDMLGPKRVIAEFSKKDYMTFLKQYFSGEELRNFLFSLHPIPSMPAFFQMLNVTTQHYYPKGGMQGLTNAITDSMRGNGGVVKLRTEVSRIIVKNGHAVGVETTDGEIYHAGKVISNAAPHFTFGSLVERSHASPLMKDMINKRGLFESFCFVFLGMDKKYQEIREFDYIVFPDEVDLNINYRDYTPENSPLTIYRYPQQAEGTDYAVYLGTVLPYEYNNSWGTGKTGERGEEYNRIKLNAQETLIERVSSYLGEDFRKNIKTMFTATPITYERYTNATHGAMMGWSMQDWRLSFKETFLPFETAVKDLYLVGQFVFPGGGIPGALLSGMFLAKDLLSKEGIDLEKDFREVYRRSVALENAA